MVATISGCLQWFFRVSAVLFLGVSWGTLVWVAVFIKLQATVFPAVSSCFQLLLCWCFPGDILLFRSSSILGHFLVAISYFYLSLYLYYHPLLFSLCYTFGFLQLPHTYITIVSGFVFLDFLIWLIRYCRLIYLVLFYYCSH